jgi:hypothetical protein
MILFYNFWIRKVFTQIFEILVSFPPIEDPNVKWKGGMKNQGKDGKSFEGILPLKFTRICQTSAKRRRNGPIELRHRRDPRDRRNAGIC